ncbi:MAG: NepR family anti-sigma factor [Beijerinckiaceae bacterium]|nr:NepR family anti-sigma factor [Beijerinckiaceae bacterium]
MTNKQTRAEPGTVEEDTQIDEHIQRRIGAKLRSYYDELLNEPIPGKFIELLVKLDEKERREGKT